MGLLRPIAALPTIAAEFSTDGGSMPIHYFGNLALIMSGLGKDGDLIPFVLGEV